MEQAVNRGGRGHKSENPSYCKDDTQREQARLCGDAEGCARLLEAVMLYHRRRAAEWRVPVFTAIRITEGMTRASEEEYRPGVRTW